jgi:3-oxoacyl-[acyl-carrier protein] reductase
MTRAVVTGASRGIGRATALALADRGVDLALLARPSSELEAVARAARDKGRSAQLVPCDLQSAAEVARAVDAVLEGGAPDVVVSAAGVIERSSVDETSVESWDRQLHVNLRAPFLLARGLLPAMRSAGRGRFVFVGSISSTVGTAGAASYVASKWGVVGFVKSLAAELTDTGLVAVAILPGSVDTDMLVGSGFEPRMKPEDVAQTIVHFALDAPAAHNGGVVEMFGT